MLEQKAEQNPFYFNEQKARALHDRAVQLSENTERNWLELGQILVEIHDEKLHRLFGYRSFKTYANKSGLQIKDRSCYLCMQLVRHPHIDKVRHLPYSLGVKLLAVPADKIDSVLEQLDSSSSRERWMIIGRTFGEETYKQRLIARCVQLKTSLKEVEEELDSLRETARKHHRSGRLNRSRQEEKFDAQFELW